MNGHNIGCHGFNHLHAQKTDPFSSLIDFFKFNLAIKEINLTADKIELYRPPYRKFTLLTLLYVFITKKKNIFWNIDPMDYDQLSSKLVADFVLKPFKHGSIILLHDGRSNSTNTQVKVTIKALDTILQETKNIDIKFALFDSNTNI